MTVPPFAPIFEAALQRHGAAELAARLPVVKSREELLAFPDDRYLSQMSLRVFRAGLKHSLVDRKWPAFESVFFGFAPRAVRAMREEEIEATLADTRLIRHLGKLRSVRDNAAAMLRVAEEHGSFGAFLADWPVPAIVPLWERLTESFKGMGGNSAPSFLRMVGKDTFILTPSVVSALRRWEAIETPPKRREERALVQSLFNAWAEETGRPLAHLSMILALSIEA